MTASVLDAALLRGAIVVTPNKRLAREIVRGFDAAQLAAGRVAWPAARVQPWPVFVSDLLEVARDAGLSVPAQRLEPAQSAHLWRRAVAADPDRSELVDVDAIAALAIEAWDRLHAWGAGYESWRGFARGSEDVDAFVRWADAYARETARLGAIDAARAPDAVAAVAANLPGVQALDIVVAGFVEQSPVQGRLFDALVAAGARVAQAGDAPLPIGASPARLATCRTPHDELACALDWARRHAERDSHARIAIVVPDLAERREAVRAACEDRLCAPLQWPGRHDELRPYELSLGAPLADAPLVASALALLRIADRPLARTDAAILVRSPYLPFAPERWIARASLERLWLERGVREIDWRTLVADLGRVDRELAARWQGIVAPRRAARLPPRAWVERWRDWLDAVGWCDGQGLSSADYQAQGAWNDLISAFVRLTAVAPALRADEALDALRRLARDEVFQVEAPGARVRVLGLLEATGLAFDALWITGMAADAWPRAPEPNPLLPLAWQSERNVPRATAERELAFARELTGALAHAAPEVVFSYAAAADDHERSASPLVAMLPAFDAGPLRAGTAERMFAARPSLETIGDAFAPPIEAGAHLPGGTGLIEKFGDCPFRATAAYRLRAEPWPPSVVGLTPLERGTLVHATLDRFWRSVESHAGLLALTDAALESALASAFAQARSSLAEARWQALPPAVAASEASAVTTLVRQWIAVERMRPPFTVVATEAAATVALAGHPLAVRLDRVDALASGGVAVVDYKAGRAIGPARWFDARPQAMQLALYAKARTLASPSEPVRALVYAQLRAGDVRAIGLVDEAATWPGLTLPAGVALGDWSEARERLDASLEAVASAFAAGEARIDPRDARKLCRRCGLGPLCRIGAVGEDASASDEGTDD